MNFNQFPVLDYNPKRKVEPLKKNKKHRKTLATCTVLEDLKKG
jgi:hypothetical protein